MQREKGGRILAFGVVRFGPGEFHPERCIRWRADFDRRRDVRETIGHSPIQAGPGRSGGNAFRDEPLASSEIEKLLLQGGSGQTGRRSKAAGPLGKDRFVPIHPNDIRPQTPDMPSESRRKHL